MKRILAVWLLVACQMFGQSSGTRVLRDIQGIYTDSSRYGTKKNILDAARIVVRRPNGAYDTVTVIQYQGAGVNSSASGSGYNKTAVISIPSAAETDTTFWSSVLDSVDAMEARVDTVFTSRISVAADTTALKALSATTSRAYLNSLTSSSLVGGGLFIKKRKSDYPLNSYDVFEANQVSGDSVWVRYERLHIDNFNFEQQEFGRTYHTFVKVTSTIQSAINAITDATYYKRYMVYVPNGTYTESVTMKNWVDLIGESRNGVIITSTGGGVNTFELGGFNSMIANLTIRKVSSAGLYPLHIDGITGLHSFPFQTTTIVNNCQVEATGVSTHRAVGIGQTAYQSVFLVNSTFTAAANDAIYGHNIASQTSATELFVVNCTATGGGTGEGLRWLNEGSGQADRITLIGGAFTGDTSIVVQNDGGSGESWLHVSPTTTYTNLFNISNGQTTFSNVTYDLPKNEYEQWIKYVGRPGLDFNIGIGFGALSVADPTALDGSGRNMVAVGDSALKRNRKGYEYVAIGDAAAEADTGGVQSVVSGAFAAGRAKNVTTSTISGYKSGYGTTTSITAATLYGNLIDYDTTTGANSTVLGNSARSNGHAGVVVVGNSAVATAVNQIVLGSGSGNFIVFAGIEVRAGAGSPEGSVAAPVGSLYMNRSGGASTTLYVKESGAGSSTGWVAK